MSQLMYTKMPVGTLVKITNTRKLMIKIDEATHSLLSAKFARVAASKKLPLDRLPTFTLTDEFTDETSYFVMLSLDKYDKPHCSRYEVFRKKQISFTGVASPYDFLPVGATEQVRGLNFVLTGNIRVNDADPRHLTEEEKFIDADVDAAVAAALPLGRPELKRQ